MQAFLVCDGLSCTALLGKLINLIPETLETVLVAKDAKQDRVQSGRCCVTASNDIRHATSQHIQISELGVLCIGFDELGSKVAGAVLWAIVLLALIYGRLAEPKDVSYSGSLLDQVGQREEKPVPFGNNADERTIEVEVV